MEINFIKWMVGYAEGFELKMEQGTLHIKCPNLVYYGINFFNNYDLNVESIYYPLLLQRAIEGINRTNKYAFLANDEKLLISKWNANVYELLWSDFNNEDQAKEQALKYNYEKETE